MRGVLCSLGYPRPDDAILAQIDIQRSTKRAFLDRVDFMHFCEAYHSLHLQKMQQRFNSIDRFASDEGVGVDSICELLAYDGIRPLPTLLKEFLAGMFGSSREGLLVTFAEYLMADRAIQNDGGIFDASLVGIKEAFLDLSRRAGGGICSAQLHQALAMLGFVVRPTVVAHLLRDASGISDGSLCQLDCLTLVRKYRDAEVDAISVALAARGLEPGAALCSEELAGALQECGYVLASPEAVREAVALASATLHGCGACQQRLDEGATQVTHGFEALFLALEALRGARCFLASDLAELRVTFQGYTAAVQHHPGSSAGYPPSICDSAPVAAAVGPRRLAVFELHGAFRRLGFPVPVWRVQTVLDELDLDSHGLVDFHGFLRTAEAVRRYEVTQISEVVQEVRRFSTAAAPDASAIAATAAGAWRRPATAPTSAVSAAPAPAAARVAVGCLKGVLARLGYPPPREGAAHSPQSPARVGLWEAEAILKHRRRLRAEALARSRGFSEDEVRAHRKSFRGADPDDTGSVGPKRVARLLARLFPRSTSDIEEHRRAKALFDEAVSGSRGTMGFPEFLLLMRLVSDDHERDRLSEELFAVEATDFSRPEVRDFRALFRGGLTAPEGDVMTLGDFVSMVARIMPVISIIMETELKQLLRELEATSDEGAALGFGAFLRAMQKLQRENWHGINDAAADITSAQAGAELGKDETSTTASTAASGTWTSSKDEDHDTSAP